MNKEKEKLSRFSEVLSQLRKERGISQKNAATELGISQALLSHYEKGIRECGLDFVIKCARYYGVSTDYLLGVSENRSGTHSVGAEPIYTNDALVALSQAARALMATADGAAGSAVARQRLHDYYMLLLYRGARTLEQAGALSADVFQLETAAGKELASAALTMLDAQLLLQRHPRKSNAALPAHADTALQTLAQQAEAYLRRQYIKPTE